MDRPLNQLGEATVKLYEATLVSLYHGDWILILKTGSIGTSKYGYWYNVLDTGTRIGTKNRIQFQPNSRRPGTEISS